RSGGAIGVVGVRRKAARVPHQSTGRGIFESPPNTGPRSGSVRMLSRLLGAVRVRSVDGDSATAAFGGRMPLSRIQAINDRVWLPPAESPATTRNSAFASPSGPFASSQV